MASKKRKLFIFYDSQFDKIIYNELIVHNWDVYTAQNLEKAADLFASNLFNVGLCLFDKRCKPQKLTQLFTSFPWVNWIMCIPVNLAPEVSPDSVECKLMVEYCFDYVQVPINMEQLVLALDHADSRNESSQTLKNPDNNYPQKFGIIGGSFIMQKLFNFIEKVSREDCSVLIEGETGTGKELIAKAIHAHSNRARNPFVAINCGMYTKDLIRAELFGYEKGSFTGAYQRKIGCIEEADKGTLFLDEIGDLPYEQQVNLLRFLEERKIERIGSNEKIPVNVRVIAATHVDLKEAVKENRFREDLYYRLRVLQITTPPLRERDNDVELLAWYFFNKWVQNNTYKAKGFYPEALHLIKDYAWPGNIRELMNCVQHAIVTSENPMLTPADLGLDRRVHNRSIKTLEEGRALSDCSLITAALRRSNYNLTYAARSLGISRVSLYRLIAKYKLKV